MVAKVDGEHFDARIQELDGAAGELIRWVEADPGRWTRGRPGKWTVGQHVAHVVVSLAVPADAFEEKRPRVLDLSIPPVPPRGPLQSLWVWLVAGRGTMPRGARTPRRFEPGATPGRAETIERLRREVERYAAAGRGFSAAQLDRFWIQNPFRMQWHYTLPEMVRVQAVHVRHHMRQIEEIG